MHRDFKQLIPRAEAQGWRVEYTKSRHLKWIAPDGGVVFSSSTASDHRATKNHMKMLRRYGFRDAE